jgi:thiol-disulfide isomerase/thioredoxin
MMPMRFAIAVTVALLSVVASRAADAPKIGATVGKLKFTDIRSLPRTLNDFGKKKAIVLVFVNTNCPVAQKYFPTLQAMEKEYRDKDVQFVAVNAAEDTIIAMATHAVKYDIEFPFVKDFDGVCAKALGVTRTPEAVVLDAERKIVYRGRIDDQFRLGGTRKEPTTHELKDAIEAVLAGKKITTPETEVDGCAITFPKARKPKDANFAEHVAPILQKHCWDCHKAGGSSPFALTTYKEVSSKAEAITEVVTEQRMPPWFASHEFGPFVNRRGLSDEERTIISDWVKTGTAAGDLAKAPAPPPEVKNPWIIRDPDLVIESQEFELPATGDIPYKYAVLPHNFAEDTWVQGVQITTDNPRSLHHCNLAHASLKGGAKEENFITGYVPGGEPMNLDPGIGFLIPKGSFLVIQIHFVTTGKPEKCKIKVGLRYPRDVVQSRLRVIQLFDTKFAIPPGAPAHKVTATRTLDSDVIGVGMFSHMHVRGKDMTFTANTPDGKTDTLLIIPNYNFEWQIPYRWESGKKRFAKGTKLECIAHYDNSPFNPYNPDAKATVRNGPQTYNEMMYGFFFYTHADEKLGIRVDPKTGTVLKQEPPKP